MNTSASSSIRYSALGLGTFFLLLSLSGFLPGLIATPVHASTHGFGYVWGLFPTNYLHNAVGIAIAVWGIAAATSLGGSITFNQIASMFYGLNCVLGLLPFTSTLFGTMPLFGNNVWLSAIAAAIAYYYGFVKPQDLSIQELSSGS